MFNNLKRGLAIATISLIVGGVAVPGFTSAQTSAPNSSSVMRKHQRGGVWKELNLTDTQKQQLKTIRANTRQQMQSILTGEQRAKLESAGQSGDRKEVMKSLNLTDAQKQQMRDIRKKSREQTLAILTPEQRSKFEQLHSQRSGK
ncbi:MAG: hypothetical protein HC935_05220 [Pseudanabaena sp. SU_2_4]|nr:hypothetical protein [Pseudanabaena sp. SU_2_4]NKB18465.1 hypothetical protein [Pseudanabaena sp. CRU_2_10]